MSTADCAGLTEVCNVDFNQCVSMVSASPDVSVHGVADAGADDAGDADVPMPRDSGESGPELLDADALEAGPELPETGPAPDAGLIDSACPDGGVRLAVGYQDPDDTVSLFGNYYTAIRVDLTGGELFGYRISYMDSSRMNIALYEDEDSLPGVLLSGTSALRVDLSMNLSTPPYYHDIDLPFGGSTWVVGGTYWIVFVLENDNLIVGESNAQMSRACLQPRQGSYQQTTSRMLPRMDFMAHECADYPAPSIGVRICQ